MRRHPRRKRPAQEALRHGGGRQRLDLDSQLCIDGRATPDDAARSQRALEQLAAEEPERPNVVKLRYFAGLTIEEAADCLGFLAFEPLIAIGLTPGPGCTQQLD